MNYIQLQTLLVRTKVQPGESLQSFLIRLSRLNDYDAPETLSQLLQERVSKQITFKDRVVLPKQAETYRQLTALTCISTSDLYTASAHHFSIVLTSPDNSITFLEVLNNVSVPLLSPSHAAKQLRPEGASQFCPLCLKDSAYHRLVWMPIAVSACLDHFCLLIDCCQHCNKKVSIREIVETRCHKCKGNLTEAETSPLNNDSGLVFQHIIQSWLMNNTTPSDVTILLPREQPRILYRFIDGLQWAARILAGTEWPYLHYINRDLQRPIFKQGKEQNTITSHESYCLYTTAFKGIMNWPKGFYEFLQAYRRQLQPSKPLNDSPKADLGNLYTQWLQGHWQHPAFDFVQKAFQHYFTDTYSLNSAIVRTNVLLENPNVAEQISYINVAEAARYLGTTPKMIGVLLKTGKLTCRDLGLTDKRKYRLINRAELSVLRDKWNEETNLAEAAKWLGIAEQTVINLVKVGLLSAEHAPAEGYPYWTFSRSALIECLEKVSKHIESFPPPEKAEQGPFINLTDTPRQLFVIGLNAASILLCVAEGKIKAYFPAEHELRLGTLLFDRSSIQEYIQSVKDENNWIGREETAKDLGIKNTTLTRWVKHGLITPAVTYGHVQYFDQKSVIGFITEHITSEEAANILGIGRLTVQKWAHLGRLATTCVSGPNIDGHHSYIFHKEQLVQWREMRLTSGETARLLGISKASLHRWVVQKKIIPLDDMGGKQRWFSKQTILELSEREI